jgi:hypothetical protein
VQPHRWEIWNFMQPFCQHICILPFCDSTVLLNNSCTWQLLFSNT